MKPLPGPVSLRGSWLTLLPGALWGATLFALLAFRVPPGPGTLSNWALLALLCVALAGVHGGLFALLARAARQANRRATAVADAALALGGGVIYGLLGLSLAKLVLQKVHLRSTDLRFLAASLAQLFGEATDSERRALGLALALPCAAATLLWFVLRALRQRDITPSWRAASRLLLGSLLGLAALVSVSPTARWAATRLAPETALLARWSSPSEGARFARAFTPDPSLQARIEPYRAASPARRWNVVVVMLESVPWKRLFGAEARHASTPNLRALAAESIVFERAYATSTHSDYAQTSILASLHPRKLEQHDFFADLSYPRALPWDLLSPLGWRSALFSTQNEAWGNMLAFVRTPQLGIVRHAPDFPDAPRRGAGSETKIFEQTAVESFLAWVGTAPSEPFVAYLNFQTTHFPYVWPTEFAPPFGAAELDFEGTFLGYPREKIPILLDRFHNALAYADLWTGRLREGLEQIGVWDQTALIVVADHGEAFYEHGVPTHGTMLFEEQLRVPLLMRLPGEAPRVVGEPVSVLDALPTLYRALGLPRHGALQGRDDLLESSYSAAGRPFPFTIQGMTHEDGLLLDGWKWIVNHDRRQAALFDLAADPEEQRSLVAAEPERARALVEALEQQIARQLGYYESRGWEAGWYAPRLP